MDIINKIVINGQTYHITDYNREELEQTAQEVQANADSVSANTTTVNNAATALIEFLNTKETLTAPAIDKTLSLSGAAADSASVGAFVVDLKNLAERKYIRDYTEYRGQRSTGYKDEIFTEINGYIRGASVSYPGTITSSTSRSTYYFQAVENIFISARTAGSKGLLRISDVVPETGTGKSWVGTLYNEASGEFPTDDMPLEVEAGKYIAICSNNASNSAYIKIQTSVQQVSVLKDNIMLTKQMANDVKEIIANQTDDGYLKYAVDKVLCIGDSLTAGSSYELRDDGLHWLGNIKQNYPYFLSRILNCDVTNAGDGGETTLSWYNKHFAQYDYTQYNTVIIFLGTNGNFTDTIAEDVEAYTSYNNYADTNTGRYCKMIEQIKEANPDCQIIMVNYFSVAQGAMEGRAVLPKIAEKYNLPIVNTDEMETDRGKIYHGYTGNVHLAKYGYLYLANKIITTLNEWLKEEPSRVNFGRNRIN